MKRFKKKAKDEIKLGKKYVFGGLGFTFLGTTILVWSLPIYISPSIAMVIFNFCIFFSFFFGIFYFFWGIFKLRKMFKENSNIFLIFYGISCYILFIPLFLYGYLSNIECSPYVCIWSLSLIQIILLSLALFMFISCIISFFYELRKIKGEIIENFISKQEEENAIEPLSKKLYKIRKEENYKVCGNCGEKNRFETLNEKKGLFRCLKCDSENYL